MLLVADEAAGASEGGDGEAPPEFMRRMFGDLSGAMAAANAAERPEEDALAPPPPPPPPPHPQHLEHRQSTGSVASSSGRQHSLGDLPSPGRGAGARGDPRRASGGRLSSSSRGDFSAMGIETLSRELATLSADMERDIGKVYRKYERLERTIRAERDKRLAAQKAAQGGTRGHGTVNVS